MLNPVAPVLEGLDLSVVRGQQPDLPWLAYSVAVSASSSVRCRLFPTTRASLRREHLGICDERIFNAGGPRLQALPAGERHDSLRDLIPSLVKRAVRRDRERPLAPEEFWVLNDISFELKKGETLGIIGHNGAGKSTMLKHLSGIMQPTRGSIEVKGRLSALIEVGPAFTLILPGAKTCFSMGSSLE